MILMLCIKSFLNIYVARRGGAEVAGWTLDREIRVRFPRLPSPRVGPLMARR